jgi:hypothetical protein
MTLAFSTYQSIQVVADMQAATGHAFDLVVATKPTASPGAASVAGEDSAFALVHDNAIVPTAKRLYMTATSGCPQRQALLRRHPDRGLRRPRVPRVGDDHRGDRRGLPGADT